MLDQIIHSFVTVVMLVVIGCLFCHWIAFVAITALMIFTLSNIVSFNWKKFN